MKKGLTKTTVLLMFLLFVGGAILLPAFHRAYCADNHDCHESGQCQICQFASSPIITTASYIAPVVVSTIIGNAALLQPIIPSSSFCIATKARAPPVA